MLTDAQMQTLAAALRAETNPDVVAAMAIRNDVFLSEWCNTPSATNAWNESMSSADLFEATNIVKFDNLLPGKRDAWRLMLDYAPVNFTKQKIRKAVQDTWGDVDSVAVLQDCRRKATNGELYLGSTDEVTNGVSAKKLNYAGTIDMMEMSKALNRF